MSQTVLIIGAGPAGLTAAFELLTKNKETRVIVLESTDRIGGISCTINHKGNRIDIGGHRFFSKSDVVMDWWLARMPLQGAPALDDKILGKTKAWEKGGPDPETTDRLMLIRERISRIYYLQKFFDYPVSLKMRTILNLGLARTCFAGIGYVYARLFRRPEEKTLEDFMINRFGVPLYRMFFEDYTQKVWGKHPSAISADWGAQRIKGLSLTKALLSAFKKLIPHRKKIDLRQKETETSLIEEFFYPKYGPGHLWETVADDVRRLGGEILLNHDVASIKADQGRITEVTARTPEGDRPFPCDVCLSSMPIKDLVPALQASSPPPNEIAAIAAGLPYRDFMTVGLLVDKLAIANETKIKTLNDVVPDTWIYIQERDVRLCRLQIFNNWSPYMVKAPENTVWIGLEYMCAEGDDLWTMSDPAFIAFATEELARIGIIDAKSVLDSCRIKIQKAYPAYFGTYDSFGKVRDWLNTIPNLYCIGRNGQHRYNNQDHSMLTAMEAVNCLTTGNTSKDALWSVNSEDDYHETARA